MDRDRFSKNSTGQIVRITLPIKDWAFIPNLLPAKWEFDVNLWPLLHEAGNRLSTLNGIGQTLPNPDLLLRPLQSREAITSSSMEGTYVTPEQLLLYEMDPREPKSADDKKADWLEVFNYNRALTAGCDVLEAGQPINNHMIRQIHAVLMRGVRGRSKSPGQFRDKQVQIGSNARFVHPTPTEIRHLMDNLSDNINSTDDPLDILVKSFVIHYQFETIHPFEDGNGRVGRALLSLMIYKWCHHSKPWLYLSPYFEKYKDEYTQNMFRVSTDGEWATWIEFCLRGVVAQANDSIQRCHLFNVCRERYHQLVKSPTPRTHAIIESLFSEPLVTIVSVARKHDVTYHTAQSDVEKLADAGIVSRVDEMRPKTYFAQQLMAIAYTSNVDDIT